MIKVSSLAQPELISMIVGKTVHMTSDCEFFPNFDIKGKVLSWSMHNTEVIFKVKIPGRTKPLSVGSNMKNLAFEEII